MHLSMQYNSERRNSSFSQYFRCDSSTKEPGKIRYWKCNNSALRYRSYELKESVWSPGSACKVSRSVCNAFLETP